VIPVSTADEVRRMDAAVIDGLGLPSTALMELASSAVARQVRSLHRGGRVVVATGGGNNGGDGWAVARWLHGWGLDVAVWPVQEPRSDDARCMARVARAAGVPTTQGPDDASLLVDAVLGTGLSEAVRDDIDAALERLRDHAAPVVAVDLPSGLHADTGAALGAVPRAELTVTFARAKRGLYAGEGPDLAGRVVVADIGLGAATGARERATSFLVEPDDLRWPVRAPGAHKGDAGHLAIVAGSEAMAGAAVLACLGALAAAPGKLTLVTARGALPRLGLLPPEVMVRTSGDAVLDELPDLSWADAVVAGPGLGGGEPLPAGLASGLQRWWADSEVPTIYDADALPTTAPTSGRPRVLTPHPGEAGRLLGTSARGIQADRFSAARELSRRGVALLKGRYTLIDDGRHTRINPTGSATLATGGTGDVLSGLIGALLARGVAPLEAATTAAWVHGRAGELLPEGSTASDVASALGRAATSPGT
jgi:NAD(P)H-hydrate epimerase